MDLVLLVIFLLLSFILIALGLFIRDHTELALIGFVFLFLCSNVILFNDVTYKIGSDVNITYSYSNESLLNSSSEIHRDVYDTYTAGEDFSHSIGYWLLVLSVVGFISCIMALRGLFKKDEND